MNEWPLSVNAQGKYWLEHGEGPLLILLNIVLEILFREVRVKKEKKNISICEWYNLTYQKSKGIH